MLNYDDMYQYQIDTAVAIYRRTKLAAWLDCGLGKTIISLTAIKWLLRDKIITAALVIGPKTVCENVWEQEKNAWSHTRDLRVSVIAGDASNRLRKADEDADIYVVSRDNIAWLSERFDGLRVSKTDMLVCDESTSFKHRNTQRWKSLCQKGKRKYKLIDRFKRVVLLSGTPASESYEGLWAQIYLLDAGARLDTSITRFRAKYMVGRMIHNQLIYTDFKPGAIEEIDDRIKDLCISMQSEDYLQLPDKIDIVRWTGYTPDTLYNKMKNNGVIAIDNIHIMAAEPATRYNKLRQICSGWIYDELAEEHYCNHYKEDTFKDLLEELRSENVLVYYQYDFEREFLMLEHGAELLDTPDQQAKWNDGKIKVACAHPASIGYGNNIQHGGHVIIFYSLPLSYECYLQATKRLHRNGQKDAVKVIHLIGQGTVEEKIYSLLKEKKSALLEHLMDAMNNNNNKLI